MRICAKIELLTLARQNAFYHGVHTLCPQSCTYVVNKSVLFTVASMLMMVKPAGSIFKERAHGWSKFMGGVCQQCGMYPVGVD